MMNRQSSEEKFDPPKRIGMARKNLRVPRPIYAIHYSADSTLFTSEDEHEHNGKARHHEGIFKAWRATDWAIDFGMNKVFSLANDGRLTVRDEGLYLVYAQIHYLDEHDENGFHVLVNRQPILQCMVIIWFSSCFPYIDKRYDRTTLFPKYEINTLMKQRPLRSMRLIRGLKGGT